MRSYVPNTEKERQEMLAELGMKSFDELFHDIPEDLRLHRELDLPAPLSEMELRDALMGYVLQNEEGGLLFRGAGAYRHYIPSVVPQLAIVAALSLHDVVCRLCPGKTIGVTWPNDLL